MPEYLLSYVLTAHNQLPALRSVLERLAATRLPNEEIIVVDGGSTDGTVEYLQALQASGQLEQLLSESSQNEAHAFNKGFVMAKGQFLKIITLTDAFCLPALREAVGFMQAHPEVDALAGNTAALPLPGTSHLLLHNNAEARFRRWFEHKEVVSLPGLSLLVRRDALALTGFLHTGVAQVEEEFTYRLTSLNVSLAWSTAVLATYIRRPLPPVSQATTLANEAERMAFFHDKQQGSQMLRRIWRKSAVASMLPRPEPKSRQLPMPDVAASSENERVAACEAAMLEYNAAHLTEFVFRIQQITKAFQEPS